MLRTRIHFDKARLRALAEKELSTAMDELQKSIVPELETVTPVDTGLARASWSAAKTGDTSFIITNKQPYVKFINAGTSVLPPLRFIEGVVLRYGKPVGPAVEYED